MTAAREVRIYYTDLNRLILECVQPIVETARHHLTSCYWERHYAGGSHLRLRMRGPVDEVLGLVECLASTAHSWLQAHPSRDREDYSAARAAMLLKREGVPEPDAAALEYRNNTVLVQEEVMSHGSLPSEEADRLLIDFQHDMMPLAGAILRDERPTRELMLRLFFVHGRLSGNELPAGSVSWRSHWEGFAASCPDERIVDRIRETYRSRRGFVRKMMLETESLVEAGAWASDAVLAGWRDLYLAYREKVARLLEGGHTLTRQPTDFNGARRFRRQMEESALRESTFLRRFASDPEFLTSIQRTPEILVPRVGINLLYVLLAAVGLSPFDKFVLCYYTHRSVEEHFGCNLEDILAENMRYVVARHASAG